MGIIASAAENYETPWKVISLWLDSASTMKRVPAINQLQTAENLVASLNAEAEAGAEDGSSTRLGNPELKQAEQQVKRFQRALDKIEAEEQQHAHLVRFEKIGGIEWADIAAACPARPGMAVDERVGTNYHAAGLIAAKRSGQLLVADPEGQYEVNGKKYRGEPIDDDDWKTIQTIGNGWDIERIAWANLELNVLNGSQKLERFSKD